MKDTIKLVLLGIIAISTVYIAFFKPAGNASNKEKEKEAVVKKAPVAPKNPNAIPDIEQVAPTPADEVTYMEFVKQEHDFGKTKPGKSNKHVFKFKNTGDKPLVITNVKGSCSCTVPEKPDQPIQPGEMGEIPIVFTAKESQKGQLQQFITVTANTNPPQTQLKITANVLQ